MGSAASPIRSPELGLVRSGDDGASVVHSFTDELEDELGRGASTADPAALHEIGEVGVVQVPGNVAVAVAEPGPVSLPDAGELGSKCSLARYIPLMRSPFLFTNGCGSHSFR